MCYNLCKTLYVLVICPTFMCETKYIYLYAPYIYIYIYIYVHACMHNFKGSMTHKVLAK